MIPIFQSGFHELKQPGHSHSRHPSLSARDMSWEAILVISWQSSHEKESLSGADRGLCLGSASDIISC